MLLHQCLSDVGARLYRARCCLLNHLRGHSKIARGFNSFSRCILTNTLCCLHMLCHCTELHYGVSGIVWGVYGRALPNTVDLFSIVALASFSDVGFYAFNYGIDFHVSVVRSPRMRLAAVVANAAFGGASIIIASMRCKSDRSTVASRARRRSLRSVSFCNTAARCRTGSSIALTSFLERLGRVQRAPRGGPLRAKRLGERIVKRIAIQLL